MALQRDERVLLVRALAWTKSRARRRRRTRRLKHRARLPAPAAPTKSLVSSSSQRASLRELPIERSTATLGPWLLLAWALGFVGLLSRIVVLERRFARRLARTSDLPEGRIRGLLESCARELGVRRIPRVLLTQAVDAPALYGVFRPRLLMPADLLSTFDDSELRSVFRHELAHLKSFDAPIDRLAVLVECVHWFNPAVWFAMRRMRNERENARDSLALAHASPSERFAYGRTIIRLIERHALQPGLLRMSCPPAQLKRRISMIAEPMRSTHKTKLVAWSLTSLIGLGLLTGASTAQPGQDATTKGLETVRGDAALGDARLASRPAQGLGDARCDEPW